MKNPGSVCKKCYHVHVWPDRMVCCGQKVQGAATPEQKRTATQKEPSKELRSIHDKRWKKAKRRFELTSEELSMAHAAGFTPTRMDQTVTGKRRSGKEKMPETATPEEIELIKRVIRERYAIYRKREQERSGMAKLTVLVSPAVKVHVTVECGKAGLMLDEVIQTFLETQFPMNAATPENRRTGDPVAQVQSQPRRSQYRGLVIPRAKGGSDEA